MYFYAFKIGLIYYIVKCKHVFIHFNQISNNIILINTVTT